MQPAHQMQFDLYGGGNTIMCPAVSSASTLMMYLYKVQDAFDLICQVRYDMREGVAFFTSKGRRRAQGGSFHGLTLSFPP